MEREISNSAKKEIAEEFISAFGLSGDVRILFDVLRNATRRIDAIGYDADELPLLFKDDLKHYMTRTEINEVGRMNYERNLRPARTLA